MLNHDHSNHSQTGSASLHAHKQGDAAHSHAKEVTSQKVLSIALCLTIGFAIIEAVAGFYANSLALISDAGHMVTDAAGLILAVIAQYISKKPPSAKYSFGLGRAEALAAFVNGMGMLALMAWIAFEAVSRLVHPSQTHVAGETVTIVAAIGLCINVLVAYMLSRDNKSMNTRAALIHVMGDLLGSVAALVAGIVIQQTGWMEIDPILSIAVCFLLLNSTIAILRESYHFLMKGVPKHINYLNVGKDLEAIPGVLAVHDLHVWDMTPGFPALIGHIEIENLDQWPKIMELIKAMLLNHHQIDHVTLQPEVMGEHEEHSEHFH